MPLVFVHGVSVRKDKHYAVAEDTRNGLFRKYTLTAVAADTTKVHIDNPYWGQFGATLAWNSASLPATSYEDFGEAGSVFEEILTEMASDIQAPAVDQVLLSLARTSLRRAVDCLWTAGAYTTAKTNVAGALADLSKPALDYAKNNPQPSWLTSVKDDSQFIENFLAELDAWKTTHDPVESFGISDIWDHMKQAARELANRATAFILNPSARAVRP